MQSADSLPTPDLSHLHSIFAEGHVYEPAEDTFALLDALENDAASLILSHPRLCLEIGSGSGCVTAFLANLLGPSSASFVCTDINACAAQATLATAGQNKSKSRADVLVTSFCDALVPRIYDLVDILIFNPPYVPTSQEEQIAANADASIAGAWAGGIDGMTVTEQLLPLVSSLLSPQGVFYLVAVSQNQPEKIKERMHLKYGLHAKVQESFEHMPQKAWVSQYFLHRQC